MPLIHAKPILLGLVLDLLLGDPLWLYHPVQAIGAVARHAESAFRRALPTQLRLAGALFGIVIVTGVTALVAGASIAAFRWSPTAGLAVEALFIASGLAVNSLAREGWIVRRHLKAGHVALARERVQRIVSRDLSHEDEQGILRALIETMTENASDGVVAPLLFAVLAGAPGIWFYKTVNTLDSTIGYRNARYREFGWFCARLDDVVNLVPARVTGALIILIAFFTGQHPIKAIQAWRRDAQKGPSPNGGIPIVTFAGARDIRLGGDCMAVDGTHITIPFVGGTRSRLTVTDVSWTLAFHYLVPTLLAAGILLFL